MNTAPQDPSAAELSMKVDDLIVGLKCMFGILLVLVSLPNAFVPLMTVPKFMQIFQDALPGKPLPYLTEFVLLHRGLLFLFALAWPITGIVLLLRAKRVRTWAVTSVLLAFIIGAQLALTELSLQLPMIGLITGMSDQAGH